MNWPIREPKIQSQVAVDAEMATCHLRPATCHTRRGIHYFLRLIMLLVLLLPASAAAQDRDDPLVIPVGETYEGDLATVTRDIRVEGAVAGDVTSWSGAIVISGSVSGDVVSYSGQVTIQPGARIGGHVLASGGALQSDDSAAVAGQTIRGDSGSVALANVLELFSPSDRAGNEAVVGRVLFGAALGVFLLAFTLLCIAFWPRRTSAASLMLRQAPGRALALGLLTTLLLLLALPPLAALLAATLVGLPLLIVLLAIIQAPYIYGLAILARAAGITGGTATNQTFRSISSESESLRSANLLVTGGLTLVVALVAALAPLWGMTLYYVLASPGLGAALLSRGGLLVPAYE
jgi:cytoskeletal protein CcmA (bactofilin family)